MIFISKKSVSNKRSSVKRSLDVPIRRGVPSLLLGGAGATIGGVELQRQERGREEMLQGESYREKPSEKPKVVYPPIKKEEWFNIEIETLLKKITGEVSKAKNDLAQGTEPNWNDIYNSVQKSLVSELRLIVYENIKDKERQSAFEEYYTQRERKIMALLQSIWFNQKDRPTQLEEVSLLLNDLLK